MKTTRSNFGRKAITFGIVIFMSIALVATGFAAWLISSGSTKQGEGNVNVVTVSNANIEINLSQLGTDGKLSVDPIYFAPQSDDVSGYITHTSKESNYTENLSFPISGTIENGDKVGELTFSLRVSDSIIAAAGLSKSGETWVYTASKAYISLPSYVVDKEGNPIPLVTKGTAYGEASIDPSNNMSSPVTIKVSNDLTAEGSKDNTKTDSDFKYYLDGSTYKFRGTFKFGWGEAVGYGNPGRTLDAMDSNSGGENSFEVSNYTLAQAELLIRLINFVVNGKEFDVNSLTNNDNEPVITSGTIRAQDIDVTTIGSIGNIAGEKAADKIKNLNEALDKVEDDLTGTPYTVYITALPKQ